MKKSLTLGMAIASATIVLSFLPTHSVEAANNTSNVMTGPGFDACTDTLTPAKIAAFWDFSPYWTAGTYFGGLAANCDLNAPGASGIVLKQLSDAQFETIAYWVDYQSRCRGGSVNGTNAWTLGQDSGSRAVVDAAADLLDPGSTLVLDIEVYNGIGNDCDYEMYNFALSWSTYVHAHGYKAVIYADDLNAVAFMNSDAYLYQFYNGNHDRFDGIIMVGLAGNNNNPSVDNLPDSYDHYYLGRRAHQYWLDRWQTFDGQTMKIDNLCMRGLWTNGTANYFYPNYGGIVCTTIY